MSRWCTPAWGSTFVAGWQALSTLLIWSKELSRYKLNMIIFNDGVTDTMGTGMT